MPGRPRGPYATPLPCRRRHHDFTIRPRAPPTSRREVPAETPHGDGSLIRLQWTLAPPAHLSHASQPTGLSHAGTMIPIMPWLLTRSRAGRCTATYTATCTAALHHCRAIAATPSDPPHCAPQRKTSRGPQDGWPDDRLRLRGRPLTLHACRSPIPLLITAPTPKPAEKQRPEDPQRRGASPT